METTKLTERDEYPIELTNNAIIAVREIMTNEKATEQGLRVGVKGGGCAGFQFTLDFSDAKAEDLEMDFDGLIVFVDPISATHLEGTVIDFVRELTSSGFKFNNPYATKTCGCGESFSV